MRSPDFPADIIAAAMRALMVAEHEMVDSVASALMERDRVATERERERCANVVNTIGPFDLLDFDARETIAAAIRQP
jgi:hypothetical protein